MRERAAEALARRKDPPLQVITSLLNSDSIDSQVGACMALEKLRGKAGEAVPQLKLALTHNDYWLRVRAAMALSKIGKKALPALPELLDIIARQPSPDDPRGMEQRFVSMAVFGELLRATKSLEGVDKEQLRKAIANGLSNQDGHARSEISTVYSRLDFEELRPLLPAIMDAIERPAPSGEMFADGVRLNGLKVLASHHVEEGIQACASYLQSQNPWQSEIRTGEILRVLESYGAEAQRVVPELRETAAMFEKGEIDFPKNLSKQKARAVRKAIEAIEATDARPKLKQIK